MMIHHFIQCVVIPGIIFKILQPEIQGCFGLFRNWTTLLPIREKYGLRFGKHPWEGTMRNPTNEMGPAPS